MCTSRPQPPAANWAPCPAYDPEPGGPSPGPGQVPAGGQPAQHLGQDSSQALHLPERGQGSGLRFLRSAQGSVDGLPRCARWLAPTWQCPEAPQPRASLRHSPAWEDGALGMVVPGGPEV